MTAKEAIAFKIKENEQFNTVSVLSSWQDRINNQYKPIGDIALKNGIYYYRNNKGDKVELDMDDPEAVGKVVINMAAKRLLEGENEDR